MLGTLSQLNVTGNVTSGNINTGGIVSSVGNITGAYILGNGSRLTSLSASNITGIVANATYSANANYATSAGVAANATYATSAGSATTAITANTVIESSQPNINLLGTLIQLNVNGNITSTSGNFVGNGFALRSLTGANVTGTVANATYALTANSATYSANATYATTAGTAISIPAANIVGNVANAGYANTAGTVTNPTQTTITLLGTLLQLNSSGAISAAGNITAGAGNYFVGDGSKLTGINSTYGNANVANYLPTYSGILSTAGNITGSNLYTAGVVSAAGNVYGNYIIGNGSQLTGLPATYANANVANYLPVYSGTITAGNISVSGNINGSNINGTLNGNHNGNVAGTTVSASGNITGGNIFATNQISAVGISATTLSVATVVGGNVSVTGSVSASYLLGNGSQLTGLPATYGNANVITLLANVGNTQILTSGTIQGGNLLTPGAIVATGNINGNNFVSGSNVAVLSNVARQIWVSNVAPTLYDGKAGDIWYQTF